MKKYLYFLLFLFFVDAYAKKTLVEKPSNLTAVSIKSTEVKISWQDNSSNELGFTIYRTIDTTKFEKIEKIGSVPSNTLIFTDTSAKPSTIYYYRVSAYTNTDVELSSEFLKLKTLSGKKTNYTLVPPETIQIIKVGATTLTIQWNNKIGKEAGYKIYRTINPSSIFFKNNLIATVTKDIDFFMDTNLNANTTYYYTITAFDENGESTPSTKIAFAKTLLDKNALKIPEKPSNLIISDIRTNQLNLRWIDNSTNEKGFKIYRSTSPFLKDTLLVADLAPNTTSFADKNLSNDTPYYYTIAAYNSGGINFIEELYTTKTLKNNSSVLATIPPPPQNLYFTSVGANNVTVNWEDNAMNEDGYFIYRSTTNNLSDARIIATVGNGSTSYQDTGLSPNSSYFYTVSAFNIAGISFWNNANMLRIQTNSGNPIINPPPPPPPGGISCENFENHGIASPHLYANTRDNTLTGTFFANNQPQYLYYGEWKDALFLGNEFGSGRKLWGYLEPFRGSTNIALRTKSNNNSCSIFPDVRNTYPYSYLGDEKMSLPVLEIVANHQNLNLLFFVSTDIENRQSNYNIYGFGIKNHIPNLIFRINGSSWQAGVEYTTLTSAFSNTIVPYTKLPFINPPKDFIIDFSTDNGNSIDRYIVRRNTAGGHFAVTTTFTRVQNNEVVVCAYQGDQFTRSFLLSSSGDRLFSDEYFGNSFRLGVLNEGNYFYRFGFADSNVIVDNNFLIMVK